MQESAARNLRTAERFILAPPVLANFGKAAVSVCDISAKGARFKHEQPLEAGSKSILKLPVDGKQAPVNIEAVIVWTHSDHGVPGRFVSGVRTYGESQVIDALLAQLHASRRSARIEELRSTDRFYVVPGLDGFFGDDPVRVDDLSARGARIETKHESPRQFAAPLRFGVPQSQLDVVVAAKVMWTSVKAITGGGKSYRAGLLVQDKPELMRLAIGQLCEMNRATLDTKSLRLKLKVMRARARDLAPSHRAIEASGIPAEQFLLIQGVREELRLNPEEALHWYRRARLVINDPMTRSIAPPIADHPDALAVWEYLDRTVDPTIVSRAFALPG